MKTQAEYRREWYLKNKALCIERANKWRVSHPARRKEIYTKSRCKIRGLPKFKITPFTEVDKKLYRNPKHRWEVKNREKLLIKRSVWRANNKDKCNNAIKEWKSKNKHKLVEYSHRRRCLLRNVASYDCSAWIEKLRKRRRCYWCQCSLNKKNRTTDHITPLIKGGIHHPTNLVAACCRCNYTRQDKMPIDWCNEVNGQKIFA